MTSSRWHAALAMMLLADFAHAGDRQVKFVTDPPGAQIIIDGKVYGTTPAVVELPGEYFGRRSEPVRVSFVKEGYVSAQLFMTDGPFTSSRPGIWNSRLDHRSTHHELRRREFQAKLAPIAASSAARPGTRPEAPSGAVTKPNQEVSERVASSASTPDAAVLLAAREKFLKPGAHPAIAEAHRMMATGMGAKAMQLLSKAAAAEPRDPELATELVHVALPYAFEDQRDKPGYGVWSPQLSEELRSLLEKLVKAQPEHHAARAFLGMLLIEQNIAEGFTRTETRDVDRWIHHRSGLSERQKIGRASNDEANTGGIERGVRECELVLQADPGNRVARVALARAFRSYVQKPVDAEQHWKEAVRLDPSDVFVRHRLARESTFLSKDHPAALSQACEAARLNPGHPYAEAVLEETWLNSGSELRNATEWDEALAPCQDALRSSRPRSDAFLATARSRAAGNAAHAAIWTQYLADAVPRFRDAISLDPRNSELHRKLARVLVKLEKRDEALTAYRDALRLDPSSKELEQEMASIAAANDPAAMKGAVLRQEVVAGKHDAVAGLVRAGDVEGAWSALRERMGTHPDDLYAHGELVWVLFAKKDIPAAMAEFDNVIARRKALVESGRCVAECPKEDYFRAKLDSALAALGKSDPGLMHLVAAHFIEGGRVCDGGTRRKECAEFFGRAAFAYHHARDWQNAIEWCDEAAAHDKGIEPLCKLWRKASAGRK